MVGGKTLVIGVGPGGAESLTIAMRRRVERADIVCGGQRLLDIFPTLTGEKVAIGHNLSRIVAIIRENRGKKRVVVLASGDPGFFGIAAYLAERLGRGAIDIVPNVSSMQLAFARIGQSWEDAVFFSVHGRPLADIMAGVRGKDKICIFTDAEHTPAAVAGALLENGVANYTAYVGENLGQPGERLTRTSLRGLCKREFSPLNTLILIRNGEEMATSTAPLIGIPDAAFFRRRGGMITKQEIRAVSLAKMRIVESDTIWDIGAGSGALSIEASRLAGKGRVYAVERNEADAAVIKKNIRKFKAAGVSVIHAEAPGGLAGLPAPASVFIGGSGGKMEAIVGFVAGALVPGGRLVINLVGLENLNTALDALRQKGFAPEITLVSVARSTAVGELTRLAALNPVFVVTAIKGEG